MIKNGLETLKTDDLIGLHDMFHKMITHRGVPIKAVPSIIACLNEVDHILEKRGVLNMSTGKLIRG